MLDAALKKLSERFCENYPARLDKTPFKIAWKFSTLRSKDFLLRDVFQLTNITTLCLWFQNTTDKVQLENRYKNWETIQIIRLDGYPWAFVVFIE